jgi:hypothetical protein
LANSYHKYELTHPIGSQLTLQFRLKTHLDIVETDRNIKLGELEEKRKQGGNQLFINNKELIDNDLLVTRV